MAGIVRGGTDEQSEGQESAWAHPVPISRTMIEPNQRGNMGAPGNKETDNSRSAGVIDRCLVPRKGGLDRPAHVRSEFTDREKEGGWRRP
jgi:hypothetical protein